MQTKNIVTEFLEEKIGKRTPLGISKFVVFSRSAIISKHLTVDERKFTFYIVDSPLGKPWEL